MKTINLSKIFAVIVLLLNSIISYKLFKLILIIRELLVNNIITIDQGILSLILIILLMTDLILVDIIMFLVVNVLVQSRKLEEWKEQIKQLQLN